MLPETSCDAGSILFDFHADDHIDPPFSHYWVWGLVGTLAYCILRSIMQRAKALRLARASDTAVNPQAPLTTGDRFVCGKVEYAEGQTTAITVRVVQYGTETKTKHGWSHQWKELNRATEAWPFYVRRPNGERVRIQPGNAPLLVDKPNQITWHERASRTRIAALAPGEDVIVQGALVKDHDPESRHGSDYRSSGQGWVMHPPTLGRMEVSTEPLGERHRKRARAFGKTSIYLLIALALTNLIFLQYPFRLFGGVDTCAEIVRKDISISTDSKGRRNIHYQVFVRVNASESPILTRELHDSDWEQVEARSILAFRYVPMWRSASELGSSTSTHFLSIIFGTLVTIIGVGIYTQTRSYRRWYEGNLEDTGSGKLPEHPLGK